MQNKVLFELVVSLVQPHLVELMKVWIVVESKLVVVQTFLEAAYFILFGRKKE